MAEDRGDDADVPPAEAEVPPTDRPTEAPTSARPRPEASPTETPPTDSDDDVGGGGGGNDRSPNRRRHRLLVPAVMAGVVGVGVGVLLVVSYGGDSDGGTKLGQRLVITGAVDQFSRQDNPKSLAGGAAPFRWSTPAGTWGTARGRAYTSVPGKPRALAVVDLGSRDSDAKVRLTRVTNNAGLVFRYRGPDDYWSVVALRGYGTWALTRTVKGTRLVITNTGVTSVSDGTSIGVRLRGDTIDLVVNDKVVKKVTDNTLAAATRVGMVAEDTQARFDDFTVAGRSLSGVTSTTRARAAPATTAVGGTTTTTLRLRTGPSIPPSGSRPS